jgi:hypothetical protein
VRDSTGWSDGNSLSCVLPKITRVHFPQKKTSVDLVRELTMPTERPPFVGEVVPTFADIGCCVVSATDSPPGR